MSKPAPLLPERPRTHLHGAVGGQQRGLVANAKHNLLRLVPRVAARRWRATPWRGHQRHGAMLGDGQTAPLAPQNKSRT